MDTAKHHKERRKTDARWYGLYRRLIGYYRCFLIHFILGISTCAVLSCCFFQINLFLLEDGVFDLLCASVFDLRRPLPNHTKQVSAEMLEAAFYLPTADADGFLPYLIDGTADAYFSAYPNTGIHPLDETNKERLTVYDAAGEPLEQNEPIDAREAIPGDGESLYAYDRSRVSADEFAVIPMDLSSQRLYSAENNGILFSNQTQFTLDGNSYLAREYPIAPPAAAASALGAGKDAPLVLIIHTHGTEAYAPDGASAVEKDFSARSQDIEENVVSVGEVLAEVLRKEGISVLHETTMFDAQSYTNAYVYAAAYIKETVAQYPSIRYVFDVHRDALATSSGDIVRPVTEIDGEVCAQVMCVIGTNEKGADHDDWQDNLTVAVHLQKRLNERYPAFARPINIRSATFNAQYATGSILFEIGSSGNSVEEARSAAYYLGVVLGEMICEGNGA